MNCPTFFGSKKISRDRWIFSSDRWSSSIRALIFPISERSVDSFVLVGETFASCIRPHIGDLSKKRRSYICNRNEHNESNKIMVINHLPLGEDEERVSETKYKQLLCIRNEWHSIRFCLPGTRTVSTPTTTRSGRKRRIFEHRVQIKLAVLPDQWPNNMQTL